MKFILSIFILSSIVFAQSNKVAVAAYNINWKELITVKKVKVVAITNKLKCKQYLDIEELKTNKYRAKHYLMRNRAICADDVYIAKSKKVRFNFGSLEIEKDGEIINETDKYIKIKNLDGKIEKIYKDELGQ